MDQSEKYLVRHLTLIDDKDVEKPGACLRAPSPYHPGFAAANRSSASASLPNCERREVVSIERLVLVEKGQELWSGRLLWYGICEAVYITLPVRDLFSLYQGTGR